MKESIYMSHKCIWSSRWSFGDISGKVRHINESLCGLGRSGRQLARLLVGTVVILDLSAFRTVADSKVNL